MSSGENVFQIADKTFLWQLPGLGSKGAERGVNGEACDKILFSNLMVLFSIFEISGNITSFGKQHDSMQKCLQVYCF